MMLPWLGALSAITKPPWQFSGCFYSPLWGSFPFLSRSKSPSWFLIFLALCLEMSHSVPSHLPALMVPVLVWKFPFPRRVTASSAESSNASISEFYFSKPIQAPLMGKCPEQLAAINTSIAGWGRSRWTANIFVLNSVFELSSWVTPQQINYLQCWVINPFQPGLWQGGEGVGAVELPETIRSVPFNLVITSNLQLGSIALIGILMKWKLFWLNLGRSAMRVLLSSAYCVFLARIRWCQ